MSPSLVRKHKNKASLLKRMRLRYHLSAVFFVAFLYIHFFTSGVPFFWDDHIFHESFDQSTALQLAKSMFSLHENVLHTSRSVYGLFFKTLFAIFTYDFYYYRLIKSAIFALVMMLVFFFSTAIFKSKLYSWIVSLLIFSSFPQYIHTFVFDEPYIIAEFFKLSAFLLFIKDIHQKKSSWHSQVGIAVCTFLATRTYNPSAALVGVLILCTLVYDRKKLLRYSFLFLALLLMTFPLYDLLNHQNIAGPFGVQFNQLSQILFTGWGTHLVSPLWHHASTLSFTGLYYKPFAAILTFWTLWLFLLAAIVLVIKHLRQTEFLEKKYRTPFMAHAPFFVLFCCLWVAAELPLLLSLPEPAIRYTSALIVPVYLLVFMAVAAAMASVKKQYRKYIYCCICIAAALTIVTNLGYVSQFRIGLGGYAIALDKATQFFAQQQHHAPDKKIVVVYPPSFIMEEFLPLNTSSSTYSIQRTITFIRSKDIRDYELPLDVRKGYDDAYVVLVQYPTQKATFPLVTTSYMSNFTIVGKFDGYSSTLFDRTYLWLNNLLKKKPLKYTYYVLKFKSNDGNS